MNKSTEHYIDEIRRKVGSPEIVSTLTEDMMWSHHETLIWKADKFDGAPYFNPVYKWENYYSFSLLALIVKKGNMNLNTAVYGKVKDPNFLSLYSHEIIDKDIEKIGGPLKNNQSIHDPKEYMAKVAAAMTADIGDVEANNPGYVNLVLCGGKDSMNSLLLPWTNPVIALSAEPNYPLVCEFIKRNDLDIKVRRLEDVYDEEMLEQEQLECCCRMELSNWKWGMDLRKISNEFNKKVIFWQGQYSEILLSTDWKYMIWPRNRFNNFLGKLHRITSPYMPPIMRFWIGERVAPDSFIRAWHFSSVKLGGHMAFIRALCSALALSPYVGPNMTKLFSQVNQARAVQYDRRAELGPAILGREVWYPKENPGPEISKFRYKAQNPDQFIKILQENGIKVFEDVER